MIKCWQIAVNSLMMVFMDNKGFYAQKQSDSKTKINKEKAARIKGSLEKGEKLLKSIEDHQDCALYQAIRYMVSLKRKRCDEEILEKYEKLTEVELKLLHKEREICTDIFMLKEKLEDEINEGYKSLNKILEQVG